MKAANENTDDIDVDPSEVEAKLDPNAPTVDPKWQVRARERFELARAWVQDNPLPAIGIAVAAGFVAGRMFRR